MKNNLLKKMIIIFCFLGILYAQCIPYEQRAGKSSDPAQADTSITPINNGAIQRGFASFIADEQQGLKTASGEIFDLRELVAAHPTFPFGTIVQVTNLENNKSVKVRITDRGPFVEGRIIDVSFEAAKQLDFLDKGVVQVDIKVIGESKQ